MRGMYYDIKTQELTLPPEAKAKIDDNTLAYLKANMKQIAAQFTNSYAEFDGNTMKMAAGDFSETNAFTFTDKDGVQQITIKNSEGITEYYPVIIKNNKLYLTLDSGQQMDMVFTKG